MSCAAFARRRRPCLPARASVDPSRTQPSAVSISGWTGRRVLASSTPTSCASPSSRSLGASSIDLRARLGRRQTGEVLSAHARRSSSTSDQNLSHCYRSFSESLLRGSLTRTPARFPSVCHCRSHCRLVALVCASPLSRALPRSVRSWWSQSRAYRRLWARPGEFNTQGRR